MSTTAVGARRAAECVPAGSIRHALAGRVKLGMPPQNPLYAL
jgi:hypothetical protein